jgi:hypothetical protein
MNEGESDPGVDRATAAAAERYRYGINLTPPDVARLVRVAPETVIGWIRSGFLVASNVATGARPSYRIKPADLDSFLDSRRVEIPCPHFFRARA